MLKKVIVWTYLVLSILGFTTNAMAQEVTSPLFSSHSPLDLMIKANYNKLLKDVGENTDDHKAKIKYSDENGKRHKIKIETETRGNFRSNPSNCDFPPIQLEFEEFSDAEGTIFEGQEELKLVTHCQQEIASYQRHVYREYVVYRLYNFLTPYSFQVRLCNINYKPRYWIKNNIKPAFLIEDNDMLAGRFDGEELDNDDDYQPVDSAQYALLSLFEYMIGNTDWSVIPMQNLEIIRVDSNRHMPVPYDFDMSALVNPPYAAEAMQVDSLTFLEREYRGPAFSKKLIEKAVATFNREKQEILYFIKENALLNEQEKDRILSYIKDFYEEINRGNNEKVWIR